MTPTTADLELARSLHAECGGFLYDLGEGTYQVCDVHPSEMRSFDSEREAIDYAFRLAEAGYDETQMEAQ